MNQILGLVIEGLLTNLPSDIIGGAAVAVASYALMRWRQRRVAGRPVAPGQLPAEPTVECGREADEDLPEPGRRGLSEPPGGSRANAES